jgi:two-component system chemotaxis response regulator CheB
MEVVGAAPDPIVARQMIRTLDPDVLTLDVEMPRMDGLRFLERLMRLHPLPVLMVSSLTERGSEAALRALELGAIDFVAKPKLGIEGGLKEAGAEIVAKLRVAARARLRRPVAAAVTPSHNADALLAARTGPVTATERIIVVGASTGGTEAIKEFLGGLPPGSPGVLIAQHMPEAFTRSFAERLNHFCKLRVEEAGDRERILPGHAFVAPGHSHLLVQRDGANYVTELSRGPPVNRHRPSVDVLFRSAANCAGKYALGVLLTGMGKDGAQGLLELRRAGAHTFAQDEATCVVYGMPREAVLIGAAEDSVPLQELARRVLEVLGPSRAVRV